MRMQVLAGGLVLAIGAAFAPVASHAAVDFIVGVAPPAPRVEVVPVGRVGYDWAPGYWRWNGYRHVWVGGTWVHSRPGWHWVGSHWTPYGPHYHYVPGYWSR
jgi:WXXGXW repeat (2 copies)